MYHLMQLKYKKLEKNFEILCKLKKNVNSYINKITKNLRKKFKKLSIFILKSSLQDDQHTFLIVPPWFKNIEKSF